MEEFKYLKTTLTNQSSIQEEIKSKQFRECLLSFDVESFALQSVTQKHKDSNSQIYIFLPVILYGWETWSLTLVEERRLRVFENRVLRRISGPKRDEVTGSGGNYILRSLMICIPHQILFR